MNRIRHLTAVSLIGTAVTLLAPVVAFGQGSITTDTIVVYMNATVGTNNTASGLRSFAQGVGCTATGNYSSARGSNVTAYGEACHAEGIATIASNSGAFASCHAEGWQSVASGLYGSHAEGYATIASSTAAHSEGSGTTASGARSHAEGLTTVASGSRAHAEGNNTTASGTDSHAAGKYAYATNNYTYVWSDGTATGSSSTNQYTVYASCGIRLLGGATVGVRGGDISMGMFTNTP